MTATHRALKAELKKVQKRISVVDEIMNANPLWRIIEIRKEAQSILDTNKGDNTIISRLFKPLADEEKRMFALSKKQLSTKWIDEMMTLKSDEDNLINSIYYEERKAT